jgi:hypothetical protein
MQLFPHVLLRISGGAFAKFQSLDLPQTMPAVQALWTCKTGLDALRPQLCDSLYKVIATIPESDVRMALIALRRAVFNERPLTTDLLSRVRAHLPAPVTYHIDRYVQSLDRSAELYKRGELLYTSEVERARQRLSDLVHDEHVQMGLLLSSQSLLQHGMLYYGSTTPQMKKRALKTEQSLIKYLSRMYTKTSPFSTFTNLAMGTIAPSNGQTDATAPLWCIDQVERMAVVSHIRINNALYQYLKGLLTKNRQMCQYFPVRPNPTLAREPQHYVFLTNSNNIEAFQRLAVHPVLDLFHTLTSAHKAGIAYDTLVQTIVSNGYIDATPAEIGAYIDELIAYGFLELHLGVSGIDPDWDLALCTQLRPLRAYSPEVAALLDALAQLRQLAMAYGHAAVAQRRSILDEAYRVWHSVCMTLHAAAGLPPEERLSPAEQPASDQGTASAHSTTETSNTGQEEAFRQRSITAFYFQREQIFYEDTALNVSPRLDRASLMALMTPLHHLLRNLRQFAGYGEEQERMRHYFCQVYPQHSTVSLLQFYEDYYRDVKKPALARRAKARQHGPDHAAQPRQPEAHMTDDTTTEHDVGFAVPTITARQAHHQQWLAHFTHRICTTGRDQTAHLHLRHGDITSVNQIVGVWGQQHEDQGSSYGAFIQPFYMRQADGQRRLMGVVNAAFPGFGKMISRFLHLFDPAVTAALRRWNTAVSPDNLLLENTDASYFNANLHPPLMPYEIWMPGGHNSLPATQQIAVTELAVTLDEAHHGLRLLHQPSHQPVYVFDLGFQAHGGRSPLFRLLDQFSLATYCSHYPLVSALNAHWQAQAAGPQAAAVPWRTPRIVYDDRLVLQRQAWHFPKALLPVRQPQESDWAYFARVNAWRLEHQIPDEVFISLFERHHARAMLAPGQQLHSRDDYKPQYICFRNPFLVTLFAKLLPKVSNSLTMEEMLPSSEQLLTLGAQQHVTEWVVQWYTTEEEAA